MSRESYMTRQKPHRRLILMQSHWWPFLSKLIKKIVADAWSVLSEWFVDKFEDCPWLSSRREVLSNRPHQPVVLYLFFLSPRKLLRSVVFCNYLIRTQCDRTGLFDVHFEVHLAPSLSLSCRYLRDPRFDNCIEIVVYWRTGNGLLWTDQKEVEGLEFELIWDRSVFIRVSTGVCS